MKWLQFFTPVTSITWEEANNLIAGKLDGEVRLLDVRQPAEYAKEHMPGAKLIPLLDLNDRQSELEKDKPVIVYCAIGGRSRVAAQMLTGKGFSKVYNLSGGIKAWSRQLAVGPEDTGLHLFRGDAGPEETIIVGFGLEMGLRDFYLSMQPQVARASTWELFRKLAAIEVLHQDRLASLYSEITGKIISRNEFAEKIAGPAMEGGLTTEEYLHLYQTDPESELEVLGLALAIEAQALDLYLRAAEKSDQEEAKKILSQIAEEERSHMVMLGDDIDQWGEIE